MAHIDKLKISGRNISSNDTNGNIEIDPNGTGDIELKKDTNVTGNLGVTGTVDGRDVSVDGATLDTTAELVDDLAEGLLTHVFSGAQHGATGAIVGTTNSQTLTNKTFDNELTLKEIAAPSSPSAGYQKVYIDSSDHIMKRKDSAGNVYDLGDSGASGFENVVSKTSNYTVVSTDDVILCDASGGSFTISLITAVGINGKKYRIEKTDSSANTITIDPNSSETVKGRATLVLNGQNESVTIQSNDANWKVISEVCTKIYEQIATAFNLNTAGYATGEFAQASSNSITLPAGRWEILGLVQYTPQSGTTVWSWANTHVLAANGANTSSQPTQLTLLSGVDNIRLFVPTQDIGFQVCTTVVVDVATTQAVYIVPRVAFTTAGTATANGTLWAKRIGF